MPQDSEFIDFAGQLGRPAVFSRVLDICFAVFGLIFVAPLFCIIGLAIKLDDRGPVFYTQERIGKDFRPFRLLKFRTMVVGAEKSGLLTIPNDSRITRVGTVLRRYKLDELPQIVNVLKGEMQCVGARPEVKRYVEMFRPDYAIVLKERPGITDPASLMYRHEDRVMPSDNTEEVYVSRILPHKLQLSIEYQRRRNVVSDIRVLLTTLVKSTRT